MNPHAALQITSLNNVDGNFAIAKNSVPEEILDLMVLKDGSQIFI